MDLDCFLTIFLFISEDFRFQKKSSVLDKTKMKHNKMKHNHMKINHCQKTPRDHWKQKNAKEKNPDLLAFCFPNPQLLVLCSPVGGDVNFYFVPGLFWSILLWPRSVARVKTFTLAENISWDNFFSCPASMQALSGASACLVSTTSSYSLWKSPHKELQQRSDSHLSTSAKCWNLTIPLCLEEKWQGSYALGI